MSNCGSTSILKWWIKLVGHKIMDPEKFFTNIYFLSMCYDGKTVQISIQLRQMKYENVIDDFLIMNAHMRFQP